MIQLRKKDKVLATSIAHYELSEYTTENGTVIFDHTKGGNISEANIYRLGEVKQSWHVDFYVDRKLGHIKSIWLVTLPSSNMTYVENLEVLTNDDPQIPYFDLSIWEKANESPWPLVKTDSFLEVYHNRSNLIHLSFGEKANMLPLNNEIALQFDKQDCLTGLLINNPIEVPKLLRMKKAL